MWFLPFFSMFGAFWATLLDTCKSRRLVWIGVFLLAFAASIHATTQPIKPTGMIDQQTIRDLAFEMIRNKTDG